MATVPYTRVVNVTLERQDNFPTIRGFGVPIIISGVVSDVTAGAVDATTRTKVYGSIAEVAEDWGTGTDAYKMAQRMFGQNPAPLQVKIGYANPLNAVADEMNAIEAYDAGWYIGALDHHATWFDVAAKATDFADWFESRRKQIFMDSVDADTENPAVATSIAATLQDAYERSAVFYHDTATAYLAAAVAAYMSTRNLDAIDSAYTAKFKEMTGIAAVDKSSSAIQGVTGFVPGTGLDNTQGNFANTYIDIGGRSFLVEGCNANGGFLDEIHASDWIVTRTEEEVLALMLNRPRIPYTDRGINEFVQAIQRIMSRASASGLVADYENANGDLVPWEIAVPRVATISAAQRRQRIAPTITCRFRYSGAVHWSEIRYTMTF